MKNIVTCCDGTGNEYGRNNTNVVETCALVVKYAKQIAHYDLGAGTGGWKYCAGATMTRPRSRTYLGSSGAIELSGRARSHREEGIAELSVRIRSRSA